MAGQFTIESFKSRKHEHRTDKGKTHNYPKERVRWVRHGLSESNLTRYDRTAKDSVMDQEKKFKNPEEIRNYWRIHKQQQRAKKAKVGTR